MRKEKKTTELEILSNDAMDTTEYDVKKCEKYNDLLSIHSRKKVADRNLLIRSVAYDILKETLIVPTQKIKQIVQDQQTAKSIEVGNIQPSQRNPDTTYGLYNNDGI